MLEKFGKHIYKVLGFLIVIYAGVFSFLSLKKYYNFAYNVFDLAIFNQVFYNTSIGHYFEMTFNLHNYLADHFAPIIFLLMPFYSLNPTAPNLLIMQSIVLSLCAWPIYLISQKIIKNKIVSLVIVLLWFFNFILQNGNLYEFHLLPWAIFFILWTFYFYYNNNFKLFLLFFILALLVREDVALTLCGFLFLIFIDKKSWQWKIVPILGIIYFLLSIKIISIFNLGESNKFFLYYNYLGGDSLVTILWAWFSHPMQLIAHLFSLKNIFGSLIILVSVGFLPVLAPRYLWLLFFPFLEYALSSQGISGSVYSMHYALIFLPALFISTIFAIKKIISGQKFIFSKFILKNKKFTGLIFVFTILYFFINFSPLKDIWLLENNWDYKKDLYNLTEQITKDDSLIVSASLAANFSSRRVIYPWQYAYLGKGQFYLEDFDFPPVDYILLDTKDLFDSLSYLATQKKYNSQSWSEEVPSNFRAKLNDYNLLAVKNSLMLWQNKELSHADYNLPIYSLAENNLDVDHNNFIVAADYKKDTDYNILSLSYQKNQSADKNYLVRFYKDTYYFDVPIDYAIWPLKHWPKNKLLTFYYYLDDSIKSYQIFSWQGEMVLGSIRNAQLDYNLKAMSNKIDIGMYLD